MPLLIFVHRWLPPETVWPISFEFFDHWIMTRLNNTNNIETPERWPLLRFSDTPQWHQLLIAPCLSAEPWRIMTITVLWMMQPTWRTWWESPWKDDIWWSSLGHSNEEYAIHSKIKPSSDRSVFCHEMRGHAYATKSVIGSNCVHAKWCCVPVRVIGILDCGSQAKWETYEARVDWGSPARRRFYPLTS